jgi:L-fuculose-phosphate aldolase
MSDEVALREAICEVGRRLWQLQMVAANDGNISVRMDQDTVLCTPAGVSKGFMEPDMIARVGVDGKALGDAGASSEVAMHLEAYRLRSDANAVVHAHPAVATGYAVSGLPLPVNLLAEAVTAFGEIPVATYATPGTPEVVEAVRPYLGKHNVLLLKNHGALTLGTDLWQAYYRMEILEHFARTALVAAQLGAADEIPSDRLEQLHALRRSLGYEP